MNYNIALISGDGIGPEIVAEAKKVLDKVCEVYGHTFSYIHAVLTNTDKLLRLCLIFLCRRLTLHFLCCHCYICFFHVFSSIF